MIRTSYCGKRAVDLLLAATPVGATDIRGSRELVDDSTRKLVPVGERGIFDLSAVLSLHECLYERALRQA